ncbi:MAG: hypothetical protein V3S64_12130 [bacterium]
MELVTKKFETMGARLKVEIAESRIAALRPTARSGLIGAERFSLNVLGRGKNQYFEIQAGGEVEVEVLDVSKTGRHLLLMLRTGGRLNKAKFLCGHDEREWFAAALPEDKPVKSIATAMEALKPDAVIESQQRKKVKTRKRNKRANEGFVRQGEWFFIPVPGFDASGLIVHKHEPLSRGRGRPHMVAELVRSGGTQVWVCGEHPTGVSEKEYRRILKKNPGAGKWGWRTMMRDPAVYVRGEVSQPGGHKTIDLNGWHRVEVNTEGQSRAFGDALAFLD